MKKHLFSRMMLLALCVFSVLGTATVMADGLTNGYYYIINKANPTRALCYYGQHLHWYTTDATSPTQVFYLQKDTAGTYTDGTNYFHVQSLSSGNYYTGISNWCETTMYGTAEISQPLDFVPNTDGSFNILGHRGEGNGNIAHNMCAFQPRVVTFGNKNSSNNMADVNRDRGYNLSMWNGNANYNWTVQKLTNNQVLELVTIPNALKVYDAYLAYIQGTTGLISSGAAAKTASDLYGTGTQFFVASAESGEGNNFANLADETTSTYFQGTYSKTATYADDSTGIKAPQFFQVDLGDGVTSNGVKMKMGLRQGTWGASSQWANVTLYATNDADAAAGDYTIADCAADSKWTKIGNYSLTDTLSINTQAGTMWGLYQPSYKSIAADTYLYQDFVLRNNYRYLRFYVNLTLFPNSIMMDYTLSQFQLYNMDDLQVIGRKQAANAELLTAINNAKAALSGTVSDDDFATLTNAINAAIEKVQNNDDVTISEMGYASFVSDKNVKLPDGLTAYVVTTTVEGKAYLTEVAAAGSVLPANTPVLLKGTAGTTYELAIDNETTPVTISETNILAGNPLEITQQDSTGTYYVLSATSDTDPTPVFKKLGEGQNVPASSAYITLASDAPESISLVVGKYVDPNAPKIADGYYYIKTGNNAMVNTARFWGWNTFKAGNTAMMYYLESIGGDEYYVQSLDDGNWFADANCGYIAEFRDKAHRASVTFQEKDNGFLIRPTALRGDYNDAARYAQYGNFACDGTKTTLNSGPNVPVNPLGQWTGATWTVEAVPAAELQPALLKINLRKALEVYDLALDYTGSDTKLLTDASQIASQCQEPSANYSSFANLIDGDLNTCFQSTWNSSVWPAANGPQWLQVDLGEGKAQSSVEFQFGLRNGTWGTTEQWRDVTVYATNNAEAAAVNDSTVTALDSVATNPEWTRVADFLFSEDKAVDFVNRKGWVSSTTYYLKEKHWDIAQNTNGRYVVKDISMTKPYRFLRFYVNSTIVYSSNMFTIGDIQLTPREGVTPTSAASAEVTALAAQMDSANAALSAGNVTETDVADLEDAIAAVEGKLSDRIALGNLVDSLRNSNLVWDVGEGTIQHDSIKYDAYVKALEAAKAGVHDASADYATLASNLRTALDEALNSNYPKDGHYYVIRSVANSGSVACYNYDASVNNSNWRLRWLTYSQPDSLTAADKGYIFKFEKADGDHQYYIKNLSNQKYVGRHRNDGDTGYSGSGEGFGFVPNKFDMHVEYISTSATGKGFTINNEKATNRAGVPVSTQGGNWLGAWAYFGTSSTWRFEEVDSTQAAALDSALVSAELPEGDGYYYIVANANDTLNSYAGNGLYNYFETSVSRVLQGACDTAATPERTNAKFIYKATRTDDGHYTLKNIVNQKNIGWNGKANSAGAGLAYTKGDYSLFIEQQGDSTYLIRADKAYLINGDAIQMQSGNVAGYWYTHHRTNMFDFVGVDADDIATELQQAETADNGYGTAIFGYDAIVPEGVKVYALDTIDGTYGYLTELETGVVPANTPVVVIGEANKIYAFAVDSTLTDADALAERNILLGNVTESTALADSVTYYTIGTSSTDATKAYLIKVSSTEDHAAAGTVFVIGGANMPDEIPLKIGDPTGIRSAVNGEAREGKIYDLQGRRVVNPTKGIYIVNGKKILKK